MVVGAAAVMCDASQWQVLLPVVPCCYECLVIPNLVMPCFALSKTHQKHTIGDGLADVVAGDTLLVMPFSASKAMAGTPVTRRHSISRGS
jgi:hypothetical protein